MNSIHIWINVTRWSVLPKPKPRTIANANDFVIDCLIACHLYVHENENWYVCHEIDIHLEAEHQPSMSQCKQCSLNWINLHVSKAKWKICESETKTNESLVALVFIKNEWEMGV